MKIVIDTNVIASGIFFGGKPIEPHTDIQICRDPDDDKFISCAIEGRCLYIVSGDNDLLSIGHYKDVEIVTVTQFFDKYTELL